MRCASALSTANDPDAARRDVLDRLAAGLRGERADLAVAFASGPHAEALGRLSAEARARGIAKIFLACSGESIVGEDREVEGDPAVSLWAIRAPGMEVAPVRFNPGDDPGPGWGAAVYPEDAHTFLILADPFTFRAERLLAGLNRDVSGLRVVGGMASGGRAPGENRLVLVDEEYDDGAVGVLIGGRVAVRTVVSQGCRPIGRPMIVTKVEGNLVRELGRRPALEVFGEVFEGLSESDRALARNGLHMGRVVNEYQESFGRGDFLVRNVLGADKSGSIAVSDNFRVGQTVQFHVRDAETADEDLRGLLASRRPKHPAGALLFTCNGRGTRLFPGPDHDVGVVRELLGPLPVAGFFAMGEVGPVGDQNFLHGFTASLALFEPKG